MRLLTVLVLLILLSVGGLFYYRCTKNRRDEAKVEQHQASSATLPSAVHQPETQAEHSDTYDASKDCLYRLYLLATIMGVCVALGGIYAIYRQTHATKQAANAAERSIILQEHALGQWVQVGQWEMWIDLEDSKLRLRFYVSNPTKYLLELDTISARTPCRTKTQHWQHVQDIEVKSMVPPGSSARADVIMSVTPDQIKCFSDLEPISIGLEATIHFVDCIKRRWKQVFKGLIVVEHLWNVDPYPHNVVTPGVREVESSLTEIKE